MSDLARQRCLFHPRREAAARCPGCGRYCCRECITEHRGRVICAACLNGAGGGAGDDRRRWRRLVRPLQCGLGVLLVWMWFFYLGQTLIAIPSRFHDGSAWTGIAADGP